MRTLLRTPKGTLSLLFIRRYFERGKTKEEQIMFVYQNFVLEKQMRLTYEKACELEIIKAHKCPYNKLTDEEIKNIGLNVY